MTEAVRLLKTTSSQIRNWGWIKRMLLAAAFILFLASSFFYLTPPGTNIREALAKWVIMTQHRDWAWIFVGAQRRDDLVAAMHDTINSNGLEKIDTTLISHNQTKRSRDSLIKVEDISGKQWKGKKMTVYDPRTLRVVVPHTAGQGETVSSMVKRTGAAAGVNGGGFVDPEGLGNGFAPIGPIISGGKILYNDEDGSVPFQMVGITKDGTLIIGKYSITELMKLNISEAVMFYPRVIANGKPLPVVDDGMQPRTAICQKPNSEIIILVIDGRQTHSVGAKIKEVQDLFMEEGCVNAGFLDGGASSEMVVGDEVVTKPSSRYGERRLPSAFLVFDDPAKVKVDDVWNNITTIDPGGSYDHPGFLKEQEQLKSKPKSTPVSAPAPKTSETKTDTVRDKPASSKESSSDKSSPDTKSGYGDKEPPAKPATAPASKSSKQPDDSRSGSSSDKTADKPAAEKPAPEKPPAADKPSQPANTSAAGSGTPAPAPQPSHSAGQAATPAPVTQQTPAQPEHRPSAPAAGSVSVDGSLKTP